MASVTMVDKALAYTMQQQTERTCVKFRVHFGKVIKPRVTGLTSDTTEYELPEGQEFTPGERVWLDVFTEGYTEAMEAAQRFQQRRY